MAVSMHTMPAYAKRMLQLEQWDIDQEFSKEEKIALSLAAEGKKYICEEVKYSLPAGADETQRRAI